MASSNLFKTFGKGADVRGQIATDKALRRKATSSSLASLIAPKSAILTLDLGGAVEAVTPEGENSWVLTRNPDGSIKSLSNEIYDVTVDRDGSGSVIGVTVVPM
jgi:hypothetical protein